MKTASKGNWDAAPAFVELLGEKPVRGNLYKASPLPIKGTMKIAALAAPFALALVPSVSAWRVYFYQLENEQQGSPFITNGGPGNPGYKCHSNVDPLNQKISSMRYYSDNPEGTTRCCIRLYDSPGCEGYFGFEFCRNQFLNLDDIGHDNDVSSYSTNCRRI
ncbi:hypothetical protein CNMCM6106_009387 [Aspergillus hiratsukae]|uniref:Uncharacterized protein n=1 Tax=Aspergillus hiratsukae TaxID=1194566 RepID=A0A8H6PX46_9EURO|nr:hypothetical protein CNMCM6106_009387 [Aspergillus hiratsukae]